MKPIRTFYALTEANGLNGSGTGICPRRGKIGFTLIELLMVVAIMTILMTLVMPAVNTVFRGSQLTQGGQMINDQIALARQNALATDHSVEVRLYQYVDSQNPGNSSQYRAIQAFQIQASGSAVALGSVQTLPPSIIIDSGATLSSIIGAATGSPSVPTFTAGAALNAPIPRAGTNYNCVSFRFLPDGSTNLSPPASLWFLTVHNMTDTQSPPANFYAIQVGATNGHLRAYRP